MDNKKTIEVTFPIFDTVPGPGTYIGTLIDDPDNKEEIPTVETEESFDYLGHGTANDIHSSSNVPYPFK